MKRLKKRLIRKYTVIITTVILLGVGAAAGKPRNLEAAAGKPRNLEAAAGKPRNLGAAAGASRNPTFRNLKVLPRDIDSKTLSKIMVDEFGDGLGVACNFCHAREKGSEKLDYASDEKPEKEMARSMMRMTLQINKKYFGSRHPLLGDPLMVIGCGTCHNGQPHPVNE